MEANKGGLVVYVDSNKKLFFLTIKNINYESDMVYFNQTPSYRIVFQDNRIKAKTFVNKTLGYRINKLPGFINRPKKETGQVEIPGLFEPKKEKKPIGGFPLLFNTTKEYQSLQNFIQSSDFKVFDEWLMKNKDKLDLRPSEELKEEFSKANKNSREYFQRDIEPTIINFFKSQGIVERITGIGSFYTTNKENPGDLDYIIHFNIPFDDTKKVMPFSDKLEELKDKYRDEKGDTYINVMLFDNKNRFLNSVDLWFISHTQEKLNDVIKEREVERGGYEKALRSGAKLNEYKIRKLVRDILEEAFKSKTVAYTAAVVEDEEDIGKIDDVVKDNIPEGFKKAENYHMTIVLGELPLSHKRDVGCEVNLNIVSIGKSEDAVALGVEGDYFSKNKTQHITIAYKGRPADSKEIKEWTPLKNPFKVTAIIREMPGLEEADKFGAQLFRTNVEQPFGGPPTVFPQIEER